MRLAAMIVILGETPEFRDRFCGRGEKPRDDRAKTKSGDGGAHRSALVPHGPPGISRS